MSLQYRARVKRGCWLGCGCRVPDCGVKLKGKDDVLVVADLADEASLGAQVTVVDMLRGEFNQGFEESFIYPLCNLQAQRETSLRWLHCTTVAPSSGLPWFISWMQALACTLGQRSMVLMDVVLEGKAYLLSFLGCWSPWLVKR